MGEIAGLVVGLAVLGWGGYATVGCVARKAVLASSYTLDESIGEAAASQFSGDACTNPKLIEAFERLAAPLRAQLPADAGVMRLTVLDDPTVNAFALPGGYLFVLTGLVADATSVEEVAGVMGHEMGHAALRHGVQRVARELGARIALSVALGGLDDSLAGLAGLATDVVGLAYDRAQEQESDDFGAALLAKAGIDPAGLGAFLGRMEAHPVSGWLSTHPEPHERRQRLLEALPPVSGTAPALPTLEELRQPCHAAP